MTRTIDRAQIMRRAWVLVKKLGNTLSDGLRRAWAEAKALKTPEAIKQAHETMKNILNGKARLDVTSVFELLITGGAF